MCVQDSPAALQIEAPVSSAANATLTLRSRSKRRNLDTRPVKTGTEDAVGYSFVAVIGLSPAPGSRACPA